VRTHTHTSPPPPQALVVNEFHGYPGDFYFTSPLNTSILPPLRITGDGVIKEFGFDQVRHACATVGCSSDP
jgi:hypothetical protein